MLGAHLQVGVLICGHWVLVVSDVCSLWALGAHPWAGVLVVGDGCLLWAPGAHLWALAHYLWAVGVVCQQCPLSMEGRGWLWG